jgi:hypothetical protein
MTKTPARPRRTKKGSLGAAGQALVTSILADYEGQELEPDAREAALIQAAGEIRDRLTELEERIDSEGIVVSAPAGPRPHPLLAEARQHSIALGRLLAGIVIADSAGKSARHVNAANARWARQRAHRG